MTDDRKQDKSKSVVKRDRWQLEDPEDALPSLEDLLVEVNQELSSGKRIEEVLTREALVQVDPVSGKPHMREEGYRGEALEFYSSKTSKGHNPAIGIRGVRSDIWDTVYFITRSNEVFPEKACRVVSIVETCMIHVGLYKLDILLSGRPKVVKSRLNAIWKGAKEKRRRRQIGPYRFVNFTEREEKQQNIWCLASQDYAHIATIAEDYGWDMSFVVQIAMILAITRSSKLPRYLVNDATEEMKAFNEYLNSYVS